MTGNEIRETFLNFFAANSHRIVRSSSLVPANDPTLLFTNAGMNQFKDVFTGLEKRDYSRATTSQKVRPRGRQAQRSRQCRLHAPPSHVLRDARQFFLRRLLQEGRHRAAWELLTRDFSIPKDKLYVTVFREDDDAERLWQEVAGVPKSRIFRLDESDNFWQMGDTGPCGPCSEIYYDFGPEAGPGEFPDDPGERFVEVWNLVFMQFDRVGRRRPDASCRVLPSIPAWDWSASPAFCKASSRTTKRICFAPSSIAPAEMFGVTYGDDPRTDVALRINADHVRAAAFLVHDGVTPSNEGRGYVLRKIMRRAIRNARMIGRRRSLFI